MVNDFVGGVWTGWNAIPTYYIYSSVTGQKITDLANDGTHSGTQVYLGSTSIADQYDGDVHFKVTDPVSGSSQNIGSTGEAPDPLSPGNRTELAGLGASMPINEPMSMPPPDGNGAYVGNPDNGCVDGYGDPEPCSLTRIANHNAEVARRKRERKKPIGVVTVTQSAKLPFMQKANGPSVGLEMLADGSQDTVGEDCKLPDGTPGIRGPDGVCYAGPTASVTVTAEPEPVPQPTPEVPDSVSFDFRCKEASFGTDRGIICGERPQFHRLEENYNLVYNIRHTIYAGNEDLLTAASLVNTICGATFGAPRNPATYWRGPDGRFYKGPFSVAKAIKGVQVGTFGIGTALSGAQMLNGDVSLGEGAADVAMGGVGAFGGAPGAAAAASYFFIWKSSTPTYPQGGVRAISTNSCHGDSLQVNRRWQ